MQEPPTWDQPPTPELQTNTPESEASGVPIFCKVIAIIDLSMGVLTIFGIPMSLIGMLMLPDDAPLRTFVIPGALLTLMVGGFAILADTKMLMKKPAAVTLGYVNAAFTLLGIVFIWVQMPATMESQKMQLASDPNTANLPPGMENMMVASAVIGGAISTVVRLTLVIFVLIAVKKFKAWLVKQA